MNRFAMESFLYTADFGEDSHLFNSSSSSDSEDDVECTCPEETQPAKKFKNEGYVEIELPKLNEYDFKNSFRVSRSTFEKVLEMIRDPFMTDHKGGRERVSPEKAAYIVLWYLGNQETFKQMSDRFKKTMSCIHHIIKIGTKTLSSKIYEEIMWPSRQEYPNISKMFQDVCHMKQCIGALGVSYIKIPKFKGDSYVCAKNFHSVALQGAVTINGKFMDIYISEGSNEPEHILEKSSMPEEADKDLFGEYYLVGFNRYFSRSWLVQPFLSTAGVLTPAQQFFNSCHETAAKVFPEAMGLLKGRFQRLQYFENRDVPFVVKCVEAACMLHNLAIDCDDDAEDFFFSDTGIFDNEQEAAELENFDESGTRLRVFQELLRNEED